MAVTITRVAGALPGGFDALMADADADGHRHMQRLAAEFATTPAMFHAIYAGYSEGELAGIGAITDEPAQSSRPAWRMRRFYVLRPFRQHGVARAIASALLQEATGRVPVVTVHSGNESASRFWEAMGYVRVKDQSWTHEAATNASPPAS